jgi:hypothetical protein
MTSSLIFCISAAIIFTPNKSLLSENDSLTSVQK